MTCAREAAERVLHLFKLDDTCTVVARDEDDAWAVWCDSIGEKREDYQGSSWEQVPDDELVSIIRDVYAEHHVKDTMTAAEWAAKDGRGFLCSTEW